MITSDIPLFHTSQIRDCERIAITDLDMSELELMAKAGKVAFSALKRLFPLSKKLLVYCGFGNNAGDGYVLAKLAHEAGYLVVVNQYKSPDQLPAAARAAALAALAAGVCCQRPEDEIKHEIDLIIDALSGTGLSGNVNETLATAIQQINNSQLPVFSMDIPSGLNADTGCMMGACVRATATITFIACKLGMMTMDGPDCCGKIVCHDLGLSRCLATMSPTAHVMGTELSATLLPKRLKNCHKKDFGHVLVIGGGLGMPGSVLLAANAALRVGAGLVSIATRPEYANGTYARLPEAMIYGIERAADMQSLIESATVCVVGPGLGTDAWAIDLFECLVASQKPLVIDASALRLLARTPSQRDNWVLTPHPGEAADLLACSVAEIQADRYQSIASLQSRYGGHVVLKGVGSLVRTADSATYLCNAGNSGMATAGMGDVLSGVIGGLMAQGLQLADATRLAVSLHARAADKAVANKGERGLIASDLMPWLRFLVND